MAELFGSFLGTCYRLAIRSPYTHQKENFSIIRCSFLYLRYLMLIVYFNPDFAKSGNAKTILDLFHSFLFPFHSLLSTLDKETQTSFFYLVLINVIYIFALLVTRIAYTGYVKLKFAIYIADFIAPDIIIYLVFNFLELAPIDFYSQTLGFFLTLSICASLCIGGPIVLMNDQEPYKKAFLLFTGLKDVRKEW